MLHETIRQDLIALGYQGFLHSFDELNEIKDLSPEYQQLFAKMVQAEMSHRKARSLAYRFELAKLPQTKLLDDFECNDLPFNQAKLNELSSLDFIHQKENILFVGSSGTGKTHLALALGRKAIQNGFRAKYYTLSQLAKEMLLMKENNSLHCLVAKLTRFNLLIIDELGYLPIDKNASAALFELFSALYETTSLIINTHLDFDEWEELFGHKKSTKAIIDRITHHCQIIETGNKSWRLKSKLQYKKESEP